ncbi:MAG: tetratricopeptide repeat protein [Proteobacteria bacterium]|nr:tetratricopeptide repeat protein [Pseudomonadota bacterium]
MPDTQKHTVSPTSPTRGAMAVSLAVLFAVLAADAAAALAQLGDTDLDRGPAAELYIRKRPASPFTPQPTGQLDKLLELREKQRNDKREQAISLLRSLLATNPPHEVRSETLFKLAELLWEEARHRFVRDMNRYERQLEACRENRKRCKKRPVEPRLALAEPTRYYREILDKYPDFRRTDLVLYLVGFATREQNRSDESLVYFNQVIERFPNSPLYGDSWMMIGEHHFSFGRWRKARAAYANILERPEMISYDLALFKSAWCDWKLGQIEQAARRFKEVLDLAVEAERSGSSRVRKRRANLRDEALDYLVVVFTEDRAISAREVYDFLASIGGERYSKDVLVRVAKAYYGQSEYERAVNTYRFLIERSPTHLDAAKFQREIVGAYAESLDPKKTMAQIKILVDDFGPGSKWVEVNNKRFPSRVKRSLRRIERLVRDTATGYHAEAQKVEKARKKANLALYAQAADTYSYYLSRFGKHANAARIRFLRAEILYFKLRKYEQAGDQYMAVAKTEARTEKQKQALHKDALLKAMDAYEKARPKNVDTSRRRELLPVDRKYAEAVDLFATLFPADPEIVGVIFKNGELFYNYGDYDEAIKRFGLIVTKYPNDPNAGPAGDRILKSLSQAEDYENIEEWARKLKKAKAFQTANQQDRLDRLIIQSIGKSGEKYAKTGDYPKAATFYLRIPKEFPRHKLAPQAYMNAGVMYEKAKNPQRAAVTYLALASKYASTNRKLSAKAAFEAGKVYESVAYFDKAAEAYEVVVKNFKNSRYDANALFNAGLLRQALGQPRRAIGHYNAYARRYRDRKDAAEVAFRTGVVYEEAEQTNQAYKAFALYARKYRRTNEAYVIQAHTRAGRIALARGRTRQAGKHFKTALKMYNKLKRKSRARQASRPWAAGARYYEGELIFRQYEAINLAVKPRRLQRTLERKTQLLEQAQTAYIDVGEFEDSQWTTAALFRFANVFELYADAMRNAPNPSGLSKREQRLYREGLENYIILIEEKAIEFYTVAYKKAIKLKVYNEYTSKLRQALGRMDSSTFPPVIEARSTVRFGDRPLDPELVKEVIRDE